MHTLLSEIALTGEIEQSQHSRLNMDIAGTREYHKDTRVASWVRTKWLLQNRCRIVS